MTPCRAVGAGTAACRTGPPQTGFTLVELVVVMVVIGLLAVVAVPRFFGNPVFEERAYLDEVVSSLRYARTLAIGSGCAVRVQLNAGSYGLAQQAASAGHCNAGDATWPVVVQLPDGQPFTGAAPAGVSIAPAITIVFDAAGRTDLGADQSVTVGTRSFTVHAGSGLVTP